MMTMMNNKMQDALACHLQEPGQARYPGLLFARARAGRIQVKFSACIMYLESCIKHHLPSVMHRVSKITKSKTLGQSIAEYAVLISVVAAALLAMQIYMKRGIQAAIKCSTDQFGSQEYLETNRTVVATNSTIDTASDSSRRFQQWNDPNDGSLITEVTTSEVSNSTGVSVSWQEDEL